MTTNSELRQRARLTLQDRWGDAVILAVVYFVSCVALEAAGHVLASSVSFLGVFGSLIRLAAAMAVGVLEAVLGFGLYVTLLCFVRREGEQGTGGIFRGFGDFSRVALTMVLQAVYVFLWLLLLIIPGIVKSLSYFMVPYILHDYPELSGEAAIERSMVMMKGHKMELFLLLLSFIGWVILSILTLFVGFLWLTPYMGVSVAHFYESLKADEAEAVAEV